LEQTGAKVIPISFTTSKSELYPLLDQLSGIYFHGDSLDAYKQKKFEKFFGYVLTYTFEHNHGKSDYFPVFMLGSTLQTFIDNRAPSDQGILSPLPLYLVNNNVKLRTTIDPVKSFMLDEL
jgi:hypothetical protein